MSANNTAQYEVDIEDIDYLSHGGKALKARVFRPRGKGPFPAAVDSHGGAWIQGTPDNNDPINLRVAQSGVVVASADYRVPPDASYPGSVADTNYAVRWMKANAARFSTRPEWVGSIGTSAGGHLIALAGMKPLDPRYAAIPLQGNHDARVAFMVVMWPVICPWGRFQKLKERWAKAEELNAQRVGGGREQMNYWLTEDAMAEGSPTLALQRGDKVDLPNVLYVQCYGDTLHPRENMDQFVAGYRKAGGKVDIEMVEGEPYDRVRTQADSPESSRAIRHICAFIRQNTVDRT